VQKPLNHWGEPGGGNLCKLRGQVFGFSELAGRRLIHETSFDPANFEKPNT
jgi:hypothetical protein